MPVASIQTPDEYPDKVQAFLDDIVENEDDPQTWLILADYLEDIDPDQAALTRLTYLINYDKEDKENHHRQKQLTDLLQKKVKPVRPRRLVDLKAGPEQEWLKTPFVWIPKGGYTMSCDAFQANEVPHEVRITSSFWIAERAMTELLTRQEAQALCVRFGQTVRKQVLIPTEAQWEYACRAGTTSQFNYTTRAVLRLNPFAKHKRSLNERELALTVPNAWGLHQCHGLHIEMCRDVYAHKVADVGDMRIEPLVTENSNVTAIEPNSYVCRGYISPYQRDMRSSSRSWFTNHVPANIRPILYL